MNVEGRLDNTVRTIEVFLSVVILFIHTNNILILHNLGHYSNKLFISIFHIKLVWVYHKTNSLDYLFYIIAVHSSVVHLCFLVSVSRFALVLVHI